MRPYLHAAHISLNIFNFTVGFEVILLSLVPILSLSAVSQEIKVTFTQISIQNWNSKDSALTFLRLSDDLGFVSVTFPREFVSYSATLTLQLFCDCYTEHVRPFQHYSSLPTVIFQLFSHYYTADVHLLLHCISSATVTLEMFSHFNIAPVTFQLFSYCYTPYAESTVILQLFTHCHISAIQTHFHIPALYPPLKCSCTTTVTGPCMQSVEPLSQCGWTCVLLRTATHAQSPSQNGRKRSLLSSITFYIARGLMSTDLLCLASPIFSILKYLHVRLNWNALKRRSGLKKKLNLH